MAHDDVLVVVTDRVVDLAVQYMGVDRASLMAGTPVAEVMDSLWAMELVMLVEREYGVELDIPFPMCAGQPMDVQSMAREVLRARLRQSVARARDAGEKMTDLIALAGTA